MGTIRKKITPVTEVVLASIVADIQVLLMLILGIGIALLVTGFALLSIPIGLLAIAFIYICLKYRKYKHTLTTKQLLISEDFSKQKSIDFMVAVVIRHIGSEWTGSMTVLGVPQVRLVFTDVVTDVCYFDEIVRRMLIEYANGTKWEVPNLIKAREQITAISPDVKLAYTESILKFVIIRVFLKDGKYIPFMVTGIPDDIESILMVDKKTLVEDAHLEIPEGWMVRMTPDESVYRYIR